MHKTFMHKKGAKQNRIIMCCTARTLIRRHCLGSRGYSRSDFSGAWNWSVV